VKTQLRENTLVCAEDMSSLMPEVSSSGAAASLGLKQSRNRAKGQSAAAYRLVNLSEDSEDSLDLDAVPDLQLASPSTPAGRRRLRLRRKRRERKNDEQEVNVRGACCQRPLWWLKGLAGVIAAVLLIVFAAQSHLRIAALEIAVENGEFRENMLMFMRMTSLRLNEFING